MALPLAAALILAILEEEEEIDHAYYYDNEDGAISESDEMDGMVQEIEDVTKNLVSVV